MFHTQIPVKVCEQDKQQLSSRLSESEAARRDLIKRVNQLEQDLVASAIQQEQMRGKFDALAANATVTRTERDKLADRVGKLTQDGKHWADTIAQLNSDRDRLMRAEKDAHDENRKLLKAVAHSNAQRQTLSESIAKLEAARSQLAVQLVGLSGDRAGLSDQVKTLTNERGELFQRHMALLKRRLYCPNKPTAGEVVFCATVVTFCICVITFFVFYHIGAVHSLKIYGTIPYMNDPWRPRHANHFILDKADKPAAGPDLKSSACPPDETLPAEPVPSQKPKPEPEPLASPRTFNGQIRHCSSRVDLVEGVGSDTAHHVAEHAGLLGEGTNVNKTSCHGGSGGSDGDGGSSASVGQWADLGSGSSSPEELQRDGTGSDSSLELLFGPDNESLGDLQRDDANSATSLELLFEPGEA